MWIHWVVNIFNDITKTKHFKSEFRKKVFKNNWLLGVQELKTQVKIYEIKKSAHNSCQNK